MRPILRVVVLLLLGTATAALWVRSLREFDALALPTFDGYGIGSGGGD